MKKVLVLLFVATLFLVGCSKEESHDISPFSAYDHTMLNGDQVISSIKKFEDKPIAIIIEKGMDGMNLGVELYSFDMDTMKGRLTVAGGAVVRTKATVKEAEDFVKSKDKFEAKVIQDEDGTIIGIYFLHMPSGKN